MMAGGSVQTRTLTASTLFSACITAMISARMDLSASRGSSVRPTSELMRYNAGKVRGSNVPGAREGEAGERGSCSMGRLSTRVVVNNLWRLGQIFSCRSADLNPLTPQPFFPLPAGEKERFQNRRYLPTAIGGFAAGVMTVVNASRREWSRPVSSVTSWLALSI